MIDKILLHLSFSFGALKKCFNLKLNKHEGTVKRMWQTCKQGMH